MEYRQVSKILKMVMEANEQGMELQFSLSHKNTILYVSDASKGHVAIITAYSDSAACKHHIDNATKTLREHIKCKTK